MSLTSIPTTDAVCKSGFEWATNQKKQSPCLLAAYLEGACGSGYWNVPALPAGNRYNAPNANQTNVCLCSTVTYNAISLCGSCQGASYVTWPAWKLACNKDDISIAAYRMEIPKNTSIPQWAYQDPTQMDSSAFNVTLAQQTALLKLPDTTAATTDGTSTAGITASTQTSTQNSGSSNVGAIVGSVIGGISIIVIAVVLVLFYFKRRRSTRASSAPSQQYITKWSKNVGGGPPTLGGGSRWGGSTTGGSLWGGGRDMREVAQSTYPSNGSYPAVPIAADQQQSSVSPPNQHPYFPSNRHVTSPPAAQVIFSPTDPPHSTSIAREPSSKKPRANLITPYILPPTVANHALDGTNPSGFQPSSTDHTHRGTTRNQSPQQYQSRPVASTTPGPYSAAASAGHSRNRSGSGSSAQPAPIYLPTTVEYPKEKQVMAQFYNDPPLLPSMADRLYETPVAPSFSQTSSQPHFPLGVEIPRERPGLSRFDSSDSSTQGILSANRRYDPNDPSTFPVGNDTTRARGGDTYTRRGADVDGNPKPNPPPPSSFFNPYIPDEGANHRRKRSFEREQGMVGKAAGSRQRPLNYIDPYPDISHGSVDRTRGSLENPQKDKGLSVVTNGYQPVSTVNPYLGGNESLHTLPGTSPGTPANASSNALGFNPQPSVSSHMQSNQPPVFPEAPPSSTQHHYRSQRPYTPALSMESQQPQDLTSPDGRQSAQGSTAPLLKKFVDRGRKPKGGRNQSNDTTTTTSTDPGWSPYAPASAAATDVTFDPYRRM